MEDVEGVAGGTTDPLQCVSQEAACAKFIMKRDFQDQQALKNIMLDTS